MLKWKKTGRTVMGDGGSIITYEAEGRTAVYTIESRKRPIAHANGQGSWMYTSYFLSAHGKEAEFATLSHAKMTAERMEAVVC